MFWISSVWFDLFFLWLFQTRSRLSAFRLQSLFLNRIPGRFSNELLLFASRGQTATSGSVKARPARLPRSPRTASSRNISSPFSGLVSASPPGPMATSGSPIRPITPSGVSRSQPARLLNSLRQHPIPSRATLPPAPMATCGSPSKQWTSSAASPLMA
jgi:hypothetical protein